MERMLEGKVALVTGGGRGVGRACSIALADAGAAVVIDDLYLTEDGGSAAEELAAEIEAGGGRARACDADVTAADGADRMVATALDAFGRLDTLVACAGNVVKSDLVDLTEDQWDSIMNVHLKGHFLSCRAAARAMVAQDSGSIVTVGSRAAFWDVPSSKQAPPPGKRRPSSTAYAAAKAGIMAFTSTLALELWDTGVRANCLLPSANTQLFPGTVHNPVGGIPEASSMDPACLTPLVVYLASDSARDVSGRFFYASGGDVCLYNQPFRLPGGGSLVRKAGVWEPAELGEVLAPMMGMVAP